MGWRENIMHFPLMEVLKQRLSDQLSKSVWKVLHLGLEAKLGNKKRMVPSNSKNLEYHGF